MDTKLNLSKARANPQKPIINPSIHSQDNVQERNGEENTLRASPFGKPLILSDHPENPKFLMKNTIITTLPLFSLIDLASHCVSRVC
jgi:hypothetical protein